jgi:hypothetical protein
VKVLILESGESSSERGFFSFVIQFVSVHRHYFTLGIDYKIYFDMRNSSYSDSKDNQWNEFFLQDIITDGKRTFWGDSGNFYGYSFDFGNKTERKIAKEIIDTHLKLKSEIGTKILSLYLEMFAGKKILGVHKRGTDIGTHHESPPLQKYFEIIDKIHSNFDCIYLACDEAVSIELFKQRYPNVINLSGSTVTDDQDLPNFKKKMPDKYRMAEDVIIDAYLLSTCDLLVKMNSNLSNFSLLLNPDLDFISL